MEIYNEVLEFILAHREEGYPGHKILDNAEQEFKSVFENPGEYYIGLQLHGKGSLIITFQDNNNRYRTGTVVNLDKSL
jgi:hypothetical protein